MNLDAVLRAMNIARIFHEGQKRGAAHQTIPYFMHLVDVVTILREHDAEDPWGPAPFVLGWLHDTLEDTTYTKEQCARDFGKHMAEDVVLLTLPKDKTRDPEKTEWQIKQMTTIVTPDYVRAVKLADKTANIIDLVRYQPNWKLEHIQNYIVNARRVVDAIDGCTKRTDSDASYRTIRSLITNFDNHCGAAERFYNVVRSA